MNKNIIWLGIGAIGVCLLLSRKKASATNVEPTKDSDSTSKEPRSQADCSEDEMFSPSQKAKDIVLTKKDGTTEIVKQEAKPASCIKIRRRGGYGLPLPEDAPIGASKELLDAMEEVNKLSIGQIMGEYNNLVCRLVTAKIALTPEQSKKRAIRIRALTKVAFDRGVKLDCNINKGPYRFKSSPVGPGSDIPYGAPPIDNIKRLATGIN